MPDKAINPYTVIVRPLITEKSTDLPQANKYIFEVDIHANKPQNKAAVETAFDVTVVEVNTMVMKGKAISPIVENLRSATLPGLLEYGCLRYCIGDAIPRLPNEVVSAEHFGPAFSVFVKVIRKVGMPRWIFVVAKNVDAAQSHKRGPVSGASANFDDGCKPCNSRQSRTRRNGVSVLPDIRFRNDSSSATRSKWCA